MIFQYIRHLTTIFQQLIGMIKRDKDIWEAIRRCYDPDINKVFVNIKQYFGLLTMAQWWELIFRTFDGRGAAIFVDLLWFKEKEWTTMDWQHIFGFILQSPRWSEAINPIDPSQKKVSGLGPWKGEDDPEGGGGGGPA